MSPIQAALFLLWLAAAAYYILSAYCVRAFFERERGASSGGTAHAFPPVTILKPVLGADENTYENLKSFITQDYPRFQVVFGLADGEDPARAVIERLVEENPDKDLVLAVSGRAIGENRKISNLHNMYQKAGYGIIVIADSDMHVGPDYLKEVVRGFGDPTVSLVTCPYRGAGPRGIGAALEALTIDTDFLPSVIVAERLEGLSFALGATMAVRREALEDIGGFEALRDYLADDYHLGRLVKEAGYGLKLSGYLVDSVEGRGSIPGYFFHQLRWGRTYRACRPWGYFFSVLTRGTAFSAMFLAATGFGLYGWLVVLADLALRYAQALYMETAYIRGSGVIRYFWLLPVKDILGFVIWLLSHAGSVVRWKDASFRIDSKGRMHNIGRGKTIWP